MKQLIIILALIGFCISEPMKFGGSGIKINSWNLIAPDTVESMLLIVEAKGLVLNDTSSKPILPNEDYRGLYTTHILVRDLENEKLVYSGNLNNPFFVSMGRVNCSGNAECETNHSLEIPLEKSKQLEITIIAGSGMYKDNHNYDEFILNRFEIYFKNDRIDFLK